MWISEKMSAQHTVQQEAAAADMGHTTIGGGTASVLTRGEQRDLSVFSPTGIVWQPETGDTALVITGGSGGEERCIVAADTAAHTPEGMEPGELFLYAGDSTSVYLKKDGTIEVRGSLSIAGPVWIKGSVSVIGDVHVLGGADLTGVCHLSGTASVDGTLLINGQTCPACQ